MGEGPVLRGAGLPSRGVFLQSIPLPRPLLQLLRAEDPLHLHQRDALAAGLEGCRVAVEGVGLREAPGRVGGALHQRDGVPEGRGDRVVLGLGGDEGWGPAKVLPWLPAARLVAARSQPGVLGPVLGLSLARGTPYVQVLLQHLLPELRDLGLPILLLLAQPALPGQPLLLLVGAVDEQRRGRAAPGQREHAVVGDEAGHGVVGARWRVQRVLDGLRRGQHRVLEFVCSAGRQRLHRLAPLLGRVPPQPVQLCHGEEGPFHGFHHAQ